MRPGRAPATLWGGKAREGGQAAAIPGWLHNLTDRRVGTAPGRRSPCGGWVAGAVALAVWLSALTAAAAAPRPAMSVRVEWGMQPVRQGGEKRCPRRRVGPIQNFFPWHR